MRTHDVEPDRCPHCERHVDVATALDAEAQPPAPGDLTMCFFCGHWSAWQEDGKLGLLSTEQMVVVMTTPECIAVTRLWAKEHA